MKYVFVINKYTIGKKINKLVRRIEVVCNKLKYDYVIFVNDKMTTEQIVKKYAHSENIIFAVGGDGMINKVLNSIIGTNSILSFLPLGTGNDLYRNIKRNLSNGINTCDIVKINEKYFINVGCFGMDADIANNKDNIKILPKKLRYIGAFIKLLVQYKNRNFKISINGEEIEDFFATVVVCNGSYYGGGFQIGTNSKINDNKMEVYLVHSISKIKMIELYIKILIGHHEKAPYVKKIITNNVFIQSNDLLKCNIDGEGLTAQEFAIELRKDAIKLYYDELLITEILRNL